MYAQELLDKIKANIEAVNEGNASFDQSLWNLFIELHPADIADFFADIARNYALTGYLHLPDELKVAVFKEIPDSLKVFILAQLTPQNKLMILNSLQADELTDLFDFFSDQELRTYLNLLNRTARENVLSLMKFESDSAGGIMDLKFLASWQIFHGRKNHFHLTTIKTRKRYSSTPVCY